MFGQAPSGSQKRLLITEAVLEDLQHVLRMEGIPMVVLKGPHLAQTVYDTPEQRDWCDVDLLVRPRDFVQACTALPRSGYPISPADDLPPDRLRRSFCAVFGSRLGLSIELHQDFSEHRRYPVDVDSMVERARPFRIGAAEFLGLAPDDLLLGLIIHIVKSYFISIEQKHLMDIHFLISRETLAWPAVLEGIRTSGCAAGAYYVLEACRIQCDTPVPHEVLQTLRPSWLRRQWLNRMLDVSVFPLCRRKAHSRLWLLICLGVPLTDRLSDAARLGMRYLSLRIAQRFHHAP